MPSDDQYEDATELFSYMGERGDVDTIHDFLLCNKSLKEGKPRPPPRSRRREPPQEELKIKQPTWSKLNKETRDAWIRESNKNKDLIVEQFVGNCKAIVPATKNHNLCISYNAEFVDSEGYESNYTNNSEGTFIFVANSTMYNTTDNESNGENVSGGKELNVNAAASMIPKKSILKRNGKKRFRLSKMSAGAVGNIMASKQLEVRDPITKQIVSYITYSA